MQYIDDECEAESDEDEEKSGEGSDVETIQDETIGVHVEDQDKCNASNREFEQNEEERDISLQLQHLKRIQLESRQKMEEENARLVRQRVQRRKVCKKKSLISSDEDEISVTRSVEGEVRNSGFDFSDDVLGVEEKGNGVEDEDKGLKVGQTA